MVAQFLGLRRSKNSSHSLQPNPNTLPPLTPPKKLYGFADLLAKYSARSRTPSHFIPTLRKPLHLLATDRITLEPNTSTYATILFVTSSRMVLLILSIALRTTWSLIRLPKHFPTSKRNISLSHSVCSRLEGGVLDNQGRATSCLYPNTTKYGKCACSSCARLFSMAAGTTISPLIHAKYFLYNYLML